MPLVSYNGVSPTIDPLDFFLAPDAWITGDVTIASKVTVLFGAVLRGDIQPISIGEGSNLQEHAVVHTSRGKDPCRVGKDVTIGHHAVLHGCTVHDRCIIGMGSTILDNAVISEDCIIGANSLVTMKTVIPPGSLAVGSPARVVRKLTPAELQEIRDSAAAYRKVGRAYAVSFSA
jgi:carbonic anhydrase/acetyltransferase-like protein (isoleucine patch superfamily)